MHEMEIEQIILHIKDLPLKVVLVYLASEGIRDFAKTGYEKIKQIVVDKQNQGKYAFVPNKEEVLFLQQVERNPDFQQVKVLVPCYKYIDLIKTGLLIKEYNKKIELNDRRDEYIHRISLIKGEIMRRPGGRRLLKIVKLPSSSFFSIILSYLYELKIHGYPENHIEEEFNELVDEWDKSSLFVDKEHTLDDITEFIKKNTLDRNSRFFILALYKNQTELVEEAIKKLDEESYFKKNGYQKRIEKDDNTDLIRIEAKFFKNPSTF